MLQRRPVARAALRLLARSVLLAAACTAVGLVANTARSDGIPLVARRPYEIYVPCPETTARATAVSAADTRRSRGAVYVDARPVEEYRRRHIEGAISFPYPLLDEPSAEEVEALKKRGGRIVTYGDGGHGDLGEMLASLLTELGVPGVTHLEGGLTAWSDHGGRTEGQP